MTRRFSGFSIAVVLASTSAAHAQATIPDESPVAPPPPAPAPAAPPAAAAPPAPAAAPASAAPAPVPAPVAPPPPRPPPIPEPPLPSPVPELRGPIRDARPFFIGGELGWNGLAGFGVNFSYHPITYLAVDTG